MHLPVRTDNHIPNSQELADRIRGEVEGSVTRRFGEQLRRIEVYLQDVNGHKNAPGARCSVGAHLAGHQPVAVHDVAASVDEAVSGAMEKLARALEHTTGRLHDRGGHTSMSGEPT